jgi:CheY-like chemotaxis protein
VPVVKKGRMSDRGSKSESSQIKISELLLSAKNLSRQIEKMRRSRMLGEKVISLDDYRRLRLEEPARTILLVDDDEALLAGIRGSLTEDSFHVLAATEPMELTRMMESESLDLIIINLHIPWVNGYEFCSLMKSHRLLRDIPIIFLNEGASKDEIRRGFQAGCDEYLSKSIQPDHLVRTIRYFFNS